MAVCGAAPAARFAALDRRGFGLLARGCAWPTPWRARRRSRRPCPSWRARAGLRLRAPGGSRSCGRRGRRGSPAPARACRWRSGCRCARRAAPGAASSNLKYSPPSSVMCTSPSTYIASSVTKMPKVVAAVTTPPYSSPRCSRMYLHLSQASTSRLASSARRSLALQCRPAASQACTSLLGATVAFCGLAVGAFTRDGQPLARAWHAPRPASAASAAGTWSCPGWP